MSRPLHVAYLFSRHPVVTQTFSDSEMLALEELGMKLTVGSLRPPLNTFRHERLNRLRAEVHYLPPQGVLERLPIPAPMEELAARHAATYGGFDPLLVREAAWFERIFRREGVQHVHVHFANRATWAALFLRAAGFSFSFTAHAQDFLVSLGSHELLGEMAAGSEFVIAVSDYSQRVLRQLCPRSAEKIRRVHNGIRPTEFLSAVDFPRRQICPPAPLRILSIGNLVEFKGFHHLIEAVRRLREQDVPVQLDIVGEGDWREALQRQVREAGLRDHVFLRGVLTQDQIKRRLAASDVFALACCIDQRGRTDMLPTVIMEAMAASLPVVSTRLVAVPEMVEDGRTGFLVSPASPHELAEALRTLAADPQLRRRLGEAGRQKCEECFSLDQTAAEVKALFESVSLRLVREPAAPPSTLLLAERWHPLLATAEGAAAPAGARLLLAREDGEPPELAGEAIRYLPDAMVLESYWANEHPAVEECLRLFPQLHPSDGEEYFRQARRAVWTADLIRRRAVRHVHAADAGALLWAWLLRKLTGVHASFALEAAPPLRPDVLSTLLLDFPAGAFLDGGVPEEVRAGYPGRLEEHPATAAGGWAAVLRRLGPPGPAAAGAEEPALPPASPG